MMASTHRSTAKPSKGVVVKKAVKPKLKAKKATKKKSSVIVAKRKVTTVRKVKKVAAKGVKKAVKAKATHKGSKMPKRTVKSKVISLRRDARSSARM
jgi:hypothetical protein